MGTCLIFGVNSFTGRYVSHVFQRSGHKVIGTVFSEPNYIELPGVETHTVNLINHTQVSDVIKKTNPDFVINLAGISFIINNTVSQFYDIHILGTRNILSSLVDNKTSVSKVILASSGQIYGHSKYPDESTIVNPLSDYAVSKIAMEYMAKLWSEKLPIVITRPFNCIGIGQSKKFLVSKILSHFNEKKEIIDLGDIKISRDFLDIRSAAECYYGLAVEGVSGDVYNIASGKSYSIENILDTFSKITGHQIEVKSNPKFIRANDPLSIVANTTKIMSLPSLSQPIELRETLTWMIQGACRS